MRGPWLLDARRVRVETWAGTERRDRQRNDGLLKRHGQLWHMEGQSARPSNLVLKVDVLDELSQALAAVVVPRAPCSSKNGKPREGDKSGERAAQMARLRSRHVMHKCHGGGGAEIEYQDDDGKCSLDQGWQRAGATPDDINNNSDNNGDCGESADAHLEQIGRRSDPMGGRQAPNDHENKMADEKSDKECVA